MFLLKKPAGFVQKIERYRKNVNSILKETSGFPKKVNGDQQKILGSLTRLYEFRRKMNGFLQNIHGILKKLHHKSKDFQMDRMVLEDLLKKSLRPDHPNPLQEKRIRNEEIL